MSMNPTCWTVDVSQANIVDRLKISYIFTDNAANMKCAFKVHMPQQQSDDSESEEENRDDEHIWEDMNPGEDTEPTWLSDTLISEVEDLIDSEGEEFGAATAASDPSTDSPPVKRSCLLSCYKALKKCSSSQVSSIRTQTSKYFDATQDTDTDDALVFWYQNQVRLPQLGTEGSVSSCNLCSS
ncbi:uncharacterized protein [Nothobranchius furzeri]|nr:uncharacterized protein LOC107383792 isoform X2 [Nothobranchius furzeri]